MPPTNILRHVRNYSSAGTLSALAGIVTFPILTRNLTVEEYGILGLIAASVTLFIAVGKLGFQHAVIRFYAQIHHSKSEWSQREMNSTVFAAFAILGLIATFAWLFLGTVILPRTMEADGIPALFAVASGTVFLKLFGSSFINFLRASERSGKVAVVQIVARYSYLAFVVAMLVFSGLSPIRILACTLVAEVVAFVISIYFYRDKLSFSLADVRGKLARSMLIYGAPLMVLESLGVLLRLCDRYLIGGMLGEEELGMYSASYNLTGYLEIIVMATIAQAVRPVYMTLWERDGSERTQEFLSSSFHMYLAIGIPFVAVFSATAPHLLNFLASPKFAPGTVIIPFVTFSFMLDGALSWLGAGLYIKRNTRILMFWSMVAAVSNLVLNILVIPVYGILGASVVTVLSYLIFLGGVWTSATKYLSFDVDWKKPAVISAVCLLIYWLLMSLDFGSDLINLFAKGAIGSALCLVALMAIDKRVSDQLMGIVGSRLGRSS